LFALNKTPAPIAAPEIARQLPSVIGDNRPSRKRWIPAKTSHAGPVDRTATKSARFGYRFSERPRRADDPGPVYSALLTSLMRGATASIMP
jgi:hypothetical protein